MVHFDPNQKHFDSIQKMTIPIITNIIVKLMSTQ